MQIHISLKNLIPQSIYKKLYDVALIFNHHKFECYYVGGFIRDILLKKKIKSNDIDLATNAKPEDIMKLFQKVIPTGVKHGTVTILYKGLKLEATTYRREKIYKDHRHPEEIEYLNNIYEDLSRRDFTINAFAYNILTDTIIDEFNGLQDLQDKIIRCIGNPIERFLEDGLRPVRACRFMSTLEFQLDPNTKEAIKTKEVRNSIKSISIERFTEELKKGFQSKHTSYMLKSLYELNLLELFIQNQNIYNFYKISKYFWNYLDKFYNDIFKFSLWMWYQNFDINKISKQLKLSNYFTKLLKLYLEGIQVITDQHPFSFLSIDDINKLIKKEYQNINKSNIIKLKNYKKYLGKIKKELLEESEEFINNLRLFYIQTFFDLSKNELNINEFLELFFKWLNDILLNEPLIITDLDIDGEELKELGFNGREIGIKLNELLDCVLEDPQLNHKHLLINLIKSSK